MVLLMWRAFIIRENVGYIFFLVTKQSSHQLSQINLSDLPVSEKKIETVIYTGQSNFLDEESAHRETSTPTKQTIKTNTFIL
jgi:hypothetical protein